MNAAHRSCIAAATLAAALSLVLRLPGPAAAADASAAPLSAQDRNCLACHGQEGLTKRFAKGKPLSLRVQGSAFARSVHGPVGCAACHGEVDLKNHPGAGRKFDSAREFSIALAETCRQCHADKSKLYDASVHASVLGAGNLAAPVCSDCHGAHAVVKKGAAPAGIDGISCRTCHAAITEAYAASVHGRALGKPGAARAPVCADCHLAHDIGPAASGTRLRDACLACHAGTAAAHEKWLPNTGLHFDVVSCPACHAPEAQKRVDLRLYDPVAKRGVSTQDGQPPAGAGGGEALDARALWDLLRGVQRDGAPRKATLVGRLEVRTGAEAHQLTERARAIKDCVVCHRKGAAPFQNVTISVTGPDGRQVRYEAQHDVLHGPTSVDSVAGFYAIGGTRIGLLDLLLGLAVFAGVAAPIVHLLLRRLLGRKARAERSGGGTTDR